MYQFLSKHIHDNLYEILVVIFVITNEGNALNGSSALDKK